MASFKPTPRNRALGAVADYLSAARGVGDKVQLPVLGGIGTLMVGNAPEELDSWSYGDAPFYVPPESNLPQPKSDERAMNLADVLFASPVLRAPLKGAKLLAGGVKHAIEMAPHDFMAGPAASYVVKPKGGNWPRKADYYRAADPDSTGTRSAIENALQSVRTRTAGNGDPRRTLERLDTAYTPELLAKMDPVLAQNALSRRPELVRKSAINDWLDQKMQRYMQNEMGTPEDPVRLMADAWPAKQAELLAQKQAQIDKVTADIARKAGEAGIPPEYLTRSRAQQLALEREKQLIEQQGALHGTGLNNRRIYPNDYTRIKRTQADFPEEGMAQSKVGQNWEALTDKNIESQTAGDILERGHTDAENLVQYNPWIAKVPPETPVYDLDKYITDDLEISHLVDELGNALNPESDLPEHLKIPLDALPKLNVPAVIEHVAKINAHRAVKKAEMDMLKANNSAVHPFKEYGEGQPRWVQLKKAERAADQPSWPISTKEYDDLRDALQFEGDTMGHCVGGYCDDVASGNSNIFSLRDATGRPRVTIETLPPNKWMSGDRLTEELGARGREIWADYSNGTFLDQDLHGFLKEKYPREYEQLTAHPSIAQIKGPGNEAPDPQYLPMIQDFVRSQKWSDVGDLEHAGLHRREALPADERGLMPEVGDYLTMDEIQKLREGKQWIPIDDRPAFAKGGHVKAKPNYLRDVIGRGVVAEGLGQGIDIAQLANKYLTPDNVTNMGGVRAYDKSPVFGGTDDEPVGGSEWLGDKLAEYGLISDQRNPVGEFVASMASPFAGKLLKGARAGYAALDTPETLAKLARASEALGVPPLPVGVSHVVRPNGQNQWLRGQVEQRLDKLKPHAAIDTEYSAQLRALEDMNPGNAQNYFAWLKDRVGTTPEFQRLPRIQAYNTYAAETGAPAMQMQPEHGAINDWIDKQLTRYVKNEMATPEDPIRALAEQGKLHMGEHPDPYPTVQLSSRRLEAGFPVEGLAQSNLAKGWETEADHYMRSRPAGDFLGPEAYGDDAVVTNNPWLAKIPPETRVNYVTGLHNSDNSNVGFDHLIDTLENAINPNSGLPPELMLNPESLSRVSVPQAVERVHKINQWHKDQIAKANLAKMLEADLIKDYPESGHRWVQLNRPGQFAAESDAMGHSVRGYEPPGMGGHPDYGLGGYEAIKSGDARIYSLRDNKTGHPRVTIEVGRAPAYVLSPSDFYHLENHSDDFYKRLDDLTAGSDGTTWEKHVAESPEYKDYVTKLEQQRPLRITQIKGKSNLAPSPEYVPMIQDFVRSQGPWKTIGDISNAKMYSRSMLPAEERGLMPELGDHFTMEDLQKLRAGRNRTPIDDRPEFAEGGHVDADLIDDAVARAGHHAVVEDVLEEMGL